MTDSAPPLGEIYQRRDGMFVGVYLNQRIMSTIKNRVLAYLQTINLEEQGLFHKEAAERARGLYPYEDAADIQVNWLTIEPVQRKVEGREVASYSEADLKWKPPEKKE